MPVQELTEEFMECLKNNIPESGSVSYFDTKIKGFMLEYRSSGTGTFYLRYRNWNKKIQFMLIGRMNKLSVMEARFKAHELKKMIKEGGDPKKELQRLRDIPTFAVFVTERYLPYAKIRKRSWATDEQILRNHLLPRFGEQRLHHISRSDVIKMQFTTRSQGYAPGTCNRVLILMKFILNCALRWQVLPSGENPCVGVSLLEDNGARERYLTREEAQRLLQELDNNRNTQVAWIIKLLLFTGARKREILDAKWEHIDFERRILTVPLSKSGKARHIPLSDTAVDILKKFPGKNIFPGFFTIKGPANPRSPSLPPGTTSGNELASRMCVCMISGIPLPAFWSTPGVRSMKSRKSSDTTIQKSPCVMPTSLHNPLLKRPIKWVMPSRERFPVRPNHHCNKRRFSRSFPKKAFLRFGNTF